MPPEIDRRTALAGLGAGIVSGVACGGIRIVCLGLRRSVFDHDDVTRVGVRSGIDDDDLARVGFRSCAVGALAAATSNSEESSCSNDGKLSGSAFRVSIRVFHVRHCLVRTSRQNQRNLEACWRSGSSLPPVQEISSFLGGGAQVRVRF